MSEVTFAKAVANKLQDSLSREKGVEIRTKKSLLYAISFDEKGKLRLGMNKAREPVRGGGMGFEQDILIFERTSGNETSVVPRVVLEVKFRSITTHDVIVYSEKARCIRTVYPFVRYGLILGNADIIPGRVLRLGQEFDFILTASASMNQPQVSRLVEIISEEIDTSKYLGKLLSGERKATELCRHIKIETS